MKLRTIAEVVVAEPDKVLGILGTAAKKLFGKKKRRKRLPNRLAVKNQREVNYRSNTPIPGQTCEKCKYFDDQPGNANKCKIVEGIIRAGGWCKLWDGTGAAPP